MISTHLYQICKKYEISLIRGWEIKNRELLHTDWTDIDWLIKKSDEEDITKEIKELGFVIKRVNDLRTYGFFYENGILFFLDIIHDISADISEYFNVSFSQEYSEYFIRKFRTEERTLKKYKYLLHFKYWKLSKVTSPIKAQAFNKRLSEDLLSRDMTKRDIKKFMQRKPLTLFKFLRMKFIIQYFIKRLQDIKNNFYWWKVLIFLWPDWAWKSTIIKTLKKDFSYKVVYCGNLNTYYKHLVEYGHKFPLYRIVGKFILLFMQYTFGIIKINYLIFRWEKVLVDRLDKYTLGLNKKHKKYFSFVKRFFMKPMKSTYIWLYAEPDILQKRKWELTNEESVSQIQELKKIIKKEKGLLIDNVDIDDTLNVLLPIIIE